MKSRKQTLVLLVLTAASLPGLVACGTPEMQNAIATVVAPSIPGQIEGVVVDVTPLSPTDLAAQPPGTTEPGAGGGGSGSQPEPTTQGQQTPSGTVDVYTDSTYKFAVQYSSDFEFHPQPAEKLAELTPIPAAGFRFMNPVTAASNVPDEPADLEIRVYDAEPQITLDRWLIMNGYLPADGSVLPKPFKTAHLEGAEICASTMIAPGCSYFFLGGDWLYQLIPASQAGESMVSSFRIIP